ncbi:YidC/Oxa1 family membrane protein insertase [Candidatus Woesebacteria bacterium]|nr:YidC/Oxa1 family membrane protein insertase [Candidatus Woesebacteria bacterium]
MLAALSHWFVLIVYQPLFNLVVFFYWGIDRLTGDANMGIAVILLTIAIRILLLPQSIYGIKNERKKFGLLKEVEEVEETFASDPIELGVRKKKILRSNPMMVVGELINITIQVMIALMLWRMFATGLTGEDFHLIYSFMPAVATPFNLTFMGISLDHTSWAMNAFLTLLLFIMESLSVMAAMPGSISRSRAIKAQLVLPIVSFLFFAFMPAGKKLFVITTVIFSIVLTIVRLVLVRFDLYKQKQEEKAAQVEERVLVETK